MYMLIVFITVAILVDVLFTESTLSADQVAENRETAVVTVSVD